MIIFLQNPYLRMNDLQGLNEEWVTVDFSVPSPSVDDWIGVFSPANFR